MMMADQLSFIILFCWIIICQKPKRPHATSALIDFLLLFTNYNIALPPTRRLFMLSLLPTSTMNLDDYFGQILYREL